MIKDGHRFIFLVFFQKLPVSLIKYQVISLRDIKQHVVSNRVEIQQWQWLWDAVTMAEVTLQLNSMVKVTGSEFTRNTMEP